MVVRYEAAGEGGCLGGVPGLGRGDDGLQQAGQVVGGEVPGPGDERPDPELLLIALTRGVMEAMAGAREPEQLARWLSEDAFTSVLKRVVLANRARVVTKRAAVVPTTAIVRIIITEPVGGIIEAVLIVRSRVRARAVAIRLEGVGDRWIATAFRVL